MRSATELRYKSGYPLPWLPASYLLIGLGNEAGDTAMSIQKVLELLVADDEPLGLSQSRLSCVFPVDEETLEHLSVDSRDFHPDLSSSWGVVTQMQTSPPSCSYLPAAGAELGDALRHVFIHVEGVDDRVDLERHLVLLAPGADLVQVLQVALPALSSADQLIGRLVEAVTRDGQDVQVVTWWRTRKCLRH